jgi:hypothetical protein
MEIEAETIAYLVCSRCGLETKAMEYVAGYLRHPEGDLAAISVKVILDITRKIEDIAAYYSREKDIK